MNSQKLKALIVMFDKKQENLADALGISLSRLNAKINENNAEFNQCEIMAIKKRYNLSDAEVGEIFFNTFVS